MVIVRVNCPSCGVVDVDVDSVELVVSTVAAATRYTFRCSGCEQATTKPADETIVLLLRSGGVQERNEVVPAEALEVHSGPALTEEDLAAFLAELDQL